MNSKNEERITKYLSMLNKGMLFDELAEKYLKESGLESILSGVPVPIMPDDNGEMTNLSIMLNMAKVIGGDSTYPYTEKYIEYINYVTQDNPLSILLSEGAKAADKGEYLLACMYFRAILLIQPKSKDALYLYGRACKGAYENIDLDEEFVGNFKAESLEAFELLTMIHKDFDMGYYFLGYSYVNLGLYIKAKLTWQEFLNLHIVDDELSNEIKERLDSLEEPIAIEQGCNKVMAGDYQGGKEILEKYLSGKYNNWWPLYYHLGIAEESLGNTKDAISYLKKALTMSPSNLELMEELINLYEAVGDIGNAEKYKNKIEIVKKNIAAESEE